MSRPGDIKPRICRVNGCSHLWKCCQGSAPYGYGATPAAAYAEWERLKAKAAWRPAPKLGAWMARHRLKRHELLQFVGVLLEPHRASDGWVPVADLMHGLGISHATVYRWLGLCETAGFPIEYDGHNGRGVRCALLMRRRDGKQERRDAAASDETDGAPRVFNPVYPNALGIIKPLRGD